jgi:hypothetical protein
MQRAFSLLRRFGSSFNGEEKRMRDFSPQPISSVEEETKCWRSRSGGFQPPTNKTALWRAPLFVFAAGQGFQLCFPPKKEIAPVDQPPERLRESFVDVSLANLGAQEFAVVFYADAATGQQVGHCRNRLLGAFGAGADGEDKVTEREFRTGFEDLFSRFHDQS